MDRISGIESIPEIQEEFLALFPSVEKRAFRYARFLRRPEDREDLVGWIVCETWCRFRSDRMQGKPAGSYLFKAIHDSFVSILTSHVYTSEWKADEPLSMKNRLDGRQPISLETECFEDGENARLVHQLADRRDNPAQLAQASLDWEAWYASLTERERRHIDALATGAGASALQAVTGRSACGERCERRRLAGEWASRQEMDVGRSGQRRD